MQQQDGQAPAGEEGGEEGRSTAAGTAPQPSDPQKVLSKLMTARVRGLGVAISRQLSCVAAVRLEDPCCHSQPTCMHPPPLEMPVCPLSPQGELDVITDLVTFIEQQQFLAVEGIHRPPPTLEERTRARALRLATARQQLRGAAGLLGRGLAALQVRGRCAGRGGVHGPGKRR